MSEDGELAGKETGGESRAAGLTGRRKENSSIPTSLSFISQPTLLHPSHWRILKPSLAPSFATVPAYVTTSARERSTTANNGARRIPTLSNRLWFSQSREGEIILSFYSISCYPSILSLRTELRIGWCRGCNWIWERGYPIASNEMSTSTTISHIMQLFPSYHFMRRIAHVFCIRAYLIAKGYTTDLVMYVWRSMLAQEKGPLWTWCRWILSGIRYVNGEPRHRVYFWT